jgi:hypothetical protein
MKLKFSLLVFLIAISGFAQKKVLDHSDVELWNTIKNQTISKDGNFVMYPLEKGEKDSCLKIKDAKASLVLAFKTTE